MNASMQYRLRLAEGFLDEARQDWELRRWRACVAHAQLSVENALKAIIACFVPLAKTHDPGRTLLRLMEKQQIPPQAHGTLKDIVEEARLLGPQVHVQTDYGDEFAGQTPWELFTQEDAELALRTATRVLSRVTAWLDTPGHLQKAAS